MPDLPDQHFSHGHNIRILTNIDAIVSEVDSVMSIRERDDEESGGTIQYIILLKPGIHLVAGVP